MEPLNQEQQLGIIIEKLQDFEGRFDDFNDRFNIHVEKEDLLEKYVQDKFRTVEIVFNVIKFTGLAIVAVLTFKFGDVTRLWDHFFR
jgi:hypothetical protein